MLELLSQTLCFNGEQRRYQHASTCNQCTMTFSVYLPAKALRGETCPVVYWLSGLTCTDENFVQKAGAQRYAAELGLILIAPDTSPRGDSVPDDENAAWDFGLGAGFYVDATQAPWATHYQMYSYITQELPALIEANFPVNGQQAISGHSMGGHGALICALKNKGMFSSVTAFAPITHPSKCPWGEKAFNHYLGSNIEDWKQYDAYELIHKNSTDALSNSLPIRVDQGGADSFIDEQLMPKELAHAFGNRKTQQLHIQDGYDHSYFFIASFIGEHLKFHAQHFDQH